MKVEKLIETFIASLVSVGGFLYGGIDGIFIALISFMVIDFISGIITAIHLKKLSSNKMFHGITKKIMALLVVAIAHLIDAYVLQSQENIIKNVAISFYIANEGLSILENGAKIGIPLPKKLKEVLEQLSNEK